LSNLTEDCEHAIVHKVVTELSPIKKSAKSYKYYQDELSDGTKSIKVVAFLTSIYGQFAQ